MSGKSSFGYVKSKSGKDGARRYTLTLSDWAELLDFVAYSVTQGANPSLYQSSDGNALCLSVRHGKTSAKYWIGPDDDAREKIRLAYLEWNVPGDANFFTKQLAEALDEEEKQG